jgi:hypothetical protein
VREFSSARSSARKVYFLTAFLKNTDGKLLVIPFRFPLFSATDSMFSPGLFNPWHAARIFASDFLQTPPRGKVLAFRRKIMLKYLKLNTARRFWPYDQNFWSIIGITTHEQHELYVPGFDPTLDESANDKSCHT